MKKLKVLNKGLTSPYQNFKYEIGEKYVCNDFDTDKSNACSRGFYATDIEGLPYSWNTNRKCFEVEVSGKQVIIDQYKQRFEKQTIIREVGKTELVKMANGKEKELGYKFSEVLFPYYPLKGNPKKVTQKEIELLSQWASVRASVGDSVGASVRASVGDSVGASVWASVGASVWASVGASVGDSVGASVGDSVGAYISSLFPNIRKWKYFEHEEGENPFQPCIDLWRAGFVPSFDGDTWRLHSGKKAEVVYNLTNKQ